MKALNKNWQGPWRRGGGSLRLGPGHPGIAGETQRLNKKGRKRR